MSSIDYTPSLNFRIKKQLLIYDGEGKSTHLEIEKRLNAIFVNTYPISIVSSDYLKNTPWEFSTIALFIGGGSCSIWQKALGEKGIKKIRSFIKNHSGLYFGFCAGTYFASQKSFFLSKDLSSGKLKIFPGTIQGPMLKPRDSQILSPQNIKALDIEFKTPALKDIGKVFYQQGPYIERIKNISIFAEYILSNNFRWIIGAFLDIPSKLNKKKGKIIMCGFHPEIYPSDLTKYQNIAHLKHIKDSLSTSLLDNIWQYFKDIILTHQTLK